MPPQPQARNLNVTTPIRLMQADQEEGVANLDRAFEAKQESFHRLCDPTKSTPSFAYFELVAATGKRQFS